MSTSRYSNESILTSDNNSELTKQYCFADSDDCSPGKMEQALLNIEILRVIHDGVMNFLIYSYALYWGLWLLS